MDYTLKKLPNFSGRKGPLVFIIMDGIGIGKRDKGDAVWAAEPKNLWNYMQWCQERKLYAEIKAHGPAVGLPSEDDMGNSEVGHNAMGAGQIYSQGAKRVNEAILNGEIFKTPAWNEIVVGTAKVHKTLHFIGLLSDGNVHSHIQQLFKLMEGAVNSGIKRMRIHPLLDGRDVSPDSGLSYLQQLEDHIISLKKKDPELDIAIASGGGRMHVTMDRYYSDWNIVKRGWYAHVLGEVLKEEITNEYPGYFKSAKEAVECARRVYPTKLDQFNPTFVIVDEDGKPVGKMESGDAVVNFNFRGDRAIEITEAFIFSDSKFKGFDRGNYPGSATSKAESAGSASANGKGDHCPDIKYAGLLEYDSETHLPPKFLVPPPSIHNVISQYLCAMKIKSFAIAETHKYGHVTYFWNGNRSGGIDPHYEKFMELRSLPNETIEEQPEMKAKEVTELFLKELEKNEYHFLRINLANGDMVGHTGNIDSAKKAVKLVDECVHEIVEATLKMGGIAVVTADHGNAEEMLDKKGKPMTGHTLNPVPFLILDKEYQGEYQVDTSGIKTPGIANITATLLNLLGYEAPDFYEKSLITFKK